MFFGTHDHEIYIKRSSKFIKPRRRNLEVKMTSMEVIRYLHDIDSFDERKTRSAHAVCSINEIKCVICTVKSLNQLKIV